MHLLLHLWNRWFTFWKNCTLWNWNRPGLAALNKCLDNMYISFYRHMMLNIFWEWMNEWWSLRIFAGLEIWGFAIPLIVFHCTTFHPVNSSYECLMIRWSGNKCVSFLATRQAHSFQILLLWNNFGTTSGQLWDHFGTTLVLWPRHRQPVLKSCCCGTNLGQLWDNFGITLGQH